MAAGDILIFFGSLIGVALTICIKLFWDMYMAKKWNILLPTFVQRGNSIVWDMSQRGKIETTKDGYSVIKLRGKKETVQPPKYDVLSISKKAQPVYPIFNTARGQYFPIKAIIPHQDYKKLNLEDFDNVEVRKKIIAALNGKFIPMKMLNPPSLEVVQDSGAINWASLEHRRAREKYKKEEGWFAKYGTFAMSMILAMCIVFLVIYMTSEFKTMSSSISAAAGQMVKIMEYIYQGFIYK